MEQNWDPSNKPKYLYLTNIWKGSQEWSTGKAVSSKNVVEKTEYSHAKKRKEKEIAPLSYTIHKNYLKVD